METFKKRQKAWARKEKQQNKAARRMERRLEKARSANKTEDNISGTVNFEVPPANPAGTPNTGAESQSKPA
jgi:hypothetical protein